MKITIAQRYKPFSHLPGTKLLLPFSSLTIQVYPTLLRIFNATTETLLEEIPLLVRGPVNDFTVQQDLEKGAIHVLGHTQKGYMHYSLFADLGNPTHFHTLIKNNPENSLLLPNAISSPLQRTKPSARLALESDKKQDLDAIRRSLRMEEIFPLWYRLAQFFPDSRSRSQGSTFALLERCEETIAAKEKNALLEVFSQLFLGAFDKGFCPRLQDEEHQGFYLPSAELEANRLELLTRSCHLIESLFIKKETSSIELLPLLPPEFHCGRMVGILHTPSLSTLNFEWSKKQLRKVILESNSTSSLSLIFPKEIKRFRLRKRDEQDRGRWIDAYSIDLELEPGIRYLCDRFEHH